MKKFLVFAMAAMLAGAVSAQVIADDDASNVPPYGDGGFVGDDGGSGFQTWTADVGAGGSGSFVGNTALPGTGNDFGIYASGTEADDYISVYRKFESSLAVGDVFSFSFGHSAIWADNAASRVGFSLINNGSVAIRYWVEDGPDGSTFWQSNNGGSDFGTSVAKAENTDMAFWFSWTGGSTYSWGSGAQSFTGWTANSTISQVDEVQFFSNHQGGGENVGINNLNITAPIPEPATMGLLGLGALALVLRRKMSK